MLVDVFPILSTLNNHLNCNINNAAVCEISSLPSFQWWSDFQGTVTIDDNDQSLVHNTCTMKKYVGDYIYLLYFFLTCFPTFAILLSLHPVTFSILCFYYLFLVIGACLSWSLPSITEQVKSVLTGFLYGQLNFNSLFMCHIGAWIWQSSNFKQSPWTLKEKKQKELIHMSRLLNVLMAGGGLTLMTQTTPTT